MASGPLALIKLFTFAGIFLSAAYVEAQTIASGGVLAFDGPRSIQTTSRTTDSNGNPVIQVCSVQLTPITVNGEDSVVAVSTCVQTPDTEGGGGASTTTTGSFIATTTSSSVDTPTSTVSIPSSGSISSTSTTSVAGVERPTMMSAPSSDSIALSSTTLSSSVEASTSTASVPSGDSTSSTSLTSTPASTTSATGISTISPPPLSSVTRTSTTRITSTTTSSGTEAAASLAGAVNQGLPGKSISVLPIGLGVFAGLSVIAMIVVGAVTYERTKYRKNFRRQRLAEAGGEMGYGDMAQARV